MGKVNRSQDLYIFKMKAIEKNPASLSQGFPLRKWSNAADGEKEKQLSSH